MQLSSEERIEKDKKEIRTLSEEIIELSKDALNLPEINKKIAGIFSLISTITFYANPNNDDVKLCELSLDIVNTKIEMSVSENGNNIDPKFWQSSIMPDIDTFCFRVNQIRFTRRKRFSIAAFKSPLFGLEFKTTEDEKKSKKLSQPVVSPQTESTHLLLYSLENKLREFVAKKIKANGAKVDANIMRDWEHKKAKEALPPRKPLNSELINYSSFDQLRLIITQNENWEKVFKKYFGRQTGVISRLNELDDIRDTIAHNRMLSDFDYQSFKTLYDQIMRCVEA